MRYVFAVPTTRNFGDHVIVHAIRRLVTSRFGDPAAVWPMEVDTYPEVDHDCLLLPGITHFTPGQRPAIAAIAHLGRPAFCLSGSLWTAAPRPGFLVRSRILMARPPAPPDLSLVRLAAPPFGARDPYTFGVLQRAGIEAVYVGCASVLLEPEGVGDDGYVLFSLGRRDAHAQVRGARALARRHVVIGLCHETGDEERFRAAGWRLPLVTYRGDIGLYLSYIARARYVVSGRLHGVLPALAYGKPVFYFGTRDSRTTILDDLGVPIYPVTEVPDAIQRASASHNRYVVSHFRRNWEVLFNRIEAACATRVPRQSEPAP